MLFTYVSFYEVFVHVQMSGEVADTTEASNGGMPQPVAAPAGTESEREAASLAQVDAPSAEPSVRIRRDTEPVTTSLSTEEHSHASDNAQVSRFCSRLSLQLVMYSVSLFHRSQSLFIGVFVCQQD